MVTVTRRQIFSSPTVESAPPWFEMDCADGHMCITKANYNGKELPSGFTCDISREECERLRNAESLESNWIFGCYLDGTYFFTPSEEVPEVILAHLAVYTPMKDELVVLEFVDA